MLILLQKWVRRGKRLSGSYAWNRMLLRVIALLLLCSVIFVQILSSTAFLASAHVATPTKVARANYGCSSVSYSADGNPYPLCPGAYPLGGNCVWWAWEQWHLLGYDLPRNWGNATSWAEDAQRAGFTIGSTPRVGAIAVFPREDGYWASSSAGHVAFVTATSNDGLTFDVTYQNYGDQTFMYTGTGFNVELINQPQFQNNGLRFIYFPRLIDASLFAKLPGITASSSVTANVQSANSDLNGQNQVSTSNGTTSSVATMTTDRIALGISNASSNQEFDADFTGRGSNDLLLYNRKQGTIKVFSFSGIPQKRTWQERWLENDNSYGMKPPTNADPNFVSLGDKTTPAGKWGPDLDIHIGNFTGAATSEILLYNRVTGNVQFLSLTPDLKIKQHVTLSDIGTDWEISVGTFNGKTSGLFLYKRFASPDLATPDNDVTTDDPYSPPQDTPTTVGTPPVLIPTPTPQPTQTAPTPTPQPTATPTPKPTATATPKPTATPTPKPVATPTPTPQPTVTHQPTATATSTVQVTPTAQPTAEPTPVVTPTAAPTPTVAPAATAQPTATPTQTATTQASANVQLSYALPGSHTTTPPEESSDLKNWRKNGRTANVVLLDFDKNFKVRHREEYNLWHASWEVYVGRFASAKQDGVFLYDRIMGEGRILDFNNALEVRNYEEMHKLDSNLSVYSGDFANQGRSQLLFYDPTVGSIQLLSFDQKLKLRNTKTHTNLGEHQVLYLGHFGLPNLSIMLYDEQTYQSSFIGFNDSLEIVQQHLLKTWDERWQVLMSGLKMKGSCSDEQNCAHADIILVLNRASGQMEQYTFSFGRTFDVYDNRIQAFQRQGMAVNEHMTTVDSSTFSMVGAVSTSIRDEELY